VCRWNYTPKFYSAHESTQILKLNMQIIIHQGEKDNDATQQQKYRIFSNLIRTSFLPPCTVRTARTPAPSFGQTPALDRESNPRSILIRICPFSPLQL
jgi:hypothetical protein